MIPADWLNDVDQIVYGIFNGATTAAEIRSSLSLGSLATANTVSNSDWSGADLAILNGGTGASDAATARTNLGLEIGTDVQAWSAVLDAFGSVAATDGNFVVGDGTNFIAESGATARNSMGAAASGANSDITSLTGLTTDIAVADGGTGSSTASGARTNLGLAIGTDVQAYDVATAKLDLAQSWTGSQRAQTLTDNDLSFDMNGSQDFVCTPTALGTLTFTNITQGQRGMVRLDNSGGFAISLDAAIEGSATLAADLSVAGVYQLSYWAYSGTKVIVTASVAVV